MEQIQEGKSTENLTKYTQKEYSGLLLVFFTYFFMIITLYVYRTNRERSVMFYFIIIITIYLFIYFFYFIYLSESSESSDYSCDFCQHNPELEQLR